MNSFLSQIKSELIYSFKPPFWWLSTLFANFSLAVLVILYSFFFHHHYIRPGLIGLIMSTWLLADVTATNQLGADPNRFVLMRKNGFSAIQILTIRNIMLVIIILPISVVFAVVGDSLAHTNKLLPVDLTIAVIPIGPWIGFGNLISALLPYKQMIFKERIKRKSSIIPWIAKMSLPYIASTFTVPFCLWPLYVTKLYTNHHLSYHFGEEFILVVCWSIFVLSLGTFLAHEYLLLRPNKIDDLTE
jgi:hypothetical protein